MFGCSFMVLIKAKIKYDLVTLICTQYSHHPFHSQQHNKTNYHLCYSIIISIRFDCPSLSTLLSSTSGRNTLEVLRMCSFDSLKTTSFRKRNHLTWYIHLNPKVGWHRKCNNEMTKGLAELWKSLPCAVQSSLYPPWTVSLIILFFTFTFLHYDL